MDCRAPWLAALSACVLFVPGRAQEKPLEQSLSAGETREYRIRLALHSELEGVQPVERGAKAFAQPFARSAKGELEWVATVRVLAVAADGIASVEEKLENFQLGPTGSLGAGAEAAKWVKVIGDSFSRWSEPGTRILRYRVTRAGQLSNLSIEGVPDIEETQPLLLTLWLLHALRPAASLPRRTVRFGERWQEPRAADLEDWQRVQGWESGEWLDAPESGEPAVRLLVVQQILGSVTSGPERPPEGAAQGRFHAESLATISLADGHLLAATRSATREITWTLPSADDLAGPAQFRTQLSAEVQMEECHGPCPSASPDRDRAALRGRD
jgi:hypothetical protein